MQEVNKVCGISLNLDIINFTVDKILTFYPYRTMDAKCYSILNFDRTNETVKEFEIALWKIVGISGDNHSVLKVISNFQAYYLCFSDFKIHICLDCKKAKRNY